MSVQSRHSVEARAMERRANRSLLMSLCAIGAVAWSCRSSFGGSGSFVSGSPTQGLRSARASTAARRAFAFDIKESDDYENLVVKKEDTGIRISTHGGFLDGNYNTVLGDTEIPGSGRTYFEVKIVNKPEPDSWAYIGVADPKSDVTVPLTRNKKGAGYFWGATHTDSVVYQFIEMKKEWSDVAKKHRDTLEALVKGTEKFPPKLEPEIRKQLDENRDKVFTGPGTHVGSALNLLPPLTTGMVVGVDVDMDAGTLSFWADGKYLGAVRDTTNRPVSLKGKKLVPAISVFGRTTGKAKYFTEMEVRTGLEPPALPSK